MMAKIQEKDGRLKGSYFHMRCDEDLKEVLERYAKANNRSVAAEVEFTIRRVYGVEKPERKLELPPLLQQVAVGGEPVPTGPGRRRF